MALSACGRCQKKDDLRETCTYIPSSESRSGPLSYPIEAAASYPHQPAPAGPTLSKAEQPDEVEARGVFSDGDPGEFSSKVKAAIDAKLGLPSVKKRCPIPLTDAPLFGSLPPRQITDGSLNHAENVLPPRKHADHLVSLYWRYLEPLEPLLDQERFSRSYQSLFTGSELDCDSTSVLSMSYLRCPLSYKNRSRQNRDMRRAKRFSYVRGVCSVLRPSSGNLGHLNLSNACFS